jgi:(p)ppGpp synthase/HD superfamily hydrolase
MVVGKLGDQAPEQLERFHVIATILLGRWPAGAFHDVTRFGRQVWACTGRTREIDVRRPRARGTLAGMFAPDRYVAALRFAAERHHDQLVPGTQFPYLVHLVSVAAEVIASLPTPGVEADLAVACALLHDTIEDTATTRDEIAARFGEAVAAGVAALSKNAALPKAEQMADSLRRIREQPAAVWAVKLADRITNLGPPPEHWSVDKRTKYLEEAHQIADALGTASQPLDARIRQRMRDYATYC